MVFFIVKHHKRDREIRARIAAVGALLDKAAEGLNVDAYFSFEMMKRWLLDYADLRFLKSLGEKHFDYAEHPLKARECQLVFKHPENFRSTKNQTWVEKELVRTKTLFDSLEKYPLTDKQRDAILRNDNRVLTVAGAGTGKTSTVVGKVAHLLDSGWCKPREILLLSYSVETVGELKERIENIDAQNVNIRTFHSLGLNIIRSATGEKPNVWEPDRRQINDILKKLLNDDKKCKDLIEYLVYHFYPPKYEDSFKTVKEFNEYASKVDFQTLQTNLRTLKREKVKSFQEVQIANWLYTHGVEYEYEKQYEKYEGNYRPDFYLVDYDIYIEHFGINRDGSTRQDIDRNTYQKQMEWKRDLHKNKLTTLVETYSYQFREQTVFDELEKVLCERGVELAPMTNDTIRGIESVREDLKPLANLTSTFLNLFKADPVTLPELIEKYSEKDHYRENLFLKVFSNVLQLYEEELKTTDSIDFGDMIIQATELVSNREYKNRYKAIIVDEYQDISKARAGLINSLQKQNPDIRVLCVGDDWQSIYRFTGSDISLMTDYEQQWDAVVRIDLDQTYRFNDKILNLSSKFISQNPKQLKKTIRANTTIESPAIHISNSTIPNLLKHIKEKDTEDGADSSVFVLGRYNFTEGVRVKYPQMGVQGKTAHRSKGLEADYVIVSGMFAGKYGFPTQIADDPIISMLLADNDEFPNSEERRLFYVAITRAKKEVWLLESKNKESPSEFLIELITNETYKDLIEHETLSFDVNNKCPKCSSFMKTRINNQSGGKFLGCIHYPRCSGTLLICPKCNIGGLRRSLDTADCSNKDCDHTPDICGSSTCESGLLVLRPGKYGKFFGCSTFPDCRYTESVN